MTCFGLAAGVVSVALVLSSSAWGQSRSFEGLNDDRLWKLLKPCEDLQGNLTFQAVRPNSRLIKRARHCEKELRKPVSDDTGNPSVEIKKLLRVCEAHLAANRLTTGIGGTAVACYREVLARDRANIKALDGLQRVFQKYAAWARKALKAGEVAKARGFVEKLKGLNPEAPEVEDIQAEIVRVQKEGTESKQRAHAERERLAREKAERERAERERLAREKADRERLAREKAERDRLAREKAERERLARERAERKRLARVAAKRRWREALKRKPNFKDCPGCPEMVVVWEGRFAMGSPPSEAGRRGSEGPVHRVTIPTPFAVGKFEVTFAEWDVCVKAGGCNGYRPSDKDRGRGRNPVINVRWHDAKSYVQWLSQQTGRPYRLLSEAEWEYAARAGTTTSRYWGEDVSEQCSYANGRDESSAEFVGWWTGAECEDGFIFNSPVGRFLANRFGVFDMLGNVWEWVEDCWHDNYAGAPANGNAWTTGGDCERRVLRGGSRSAKPTRIRSAARGHGALGLRNGHTGFRVGLTLTPPP